VKTMMPFCDLKAQYEAMKTAIDFRMAKVIEHGQFIMGPEVAEFEGKLSEFLQVPHSIAVANGTDALILALKCLNIGQGDEVITTAFSFAATAESILTVGATPVFIDVDPDTALLDLSKIKSKISKRTKALMPVSLYGQCVEIAEYEKLAHESGVYLIEDGAQSFGSYQDMGANVRRHSLSFGTIACTSFFPSKPLGCYGDGGAMFTSDPAISDRLKRLRAHGQKERYHHVELGVNSRLDTLQAAILLEKLKHFPWEREERMKIASRYDQFFNSHPELGLKPLKVKSGVTSVYAQYTVVVENRSSWMEKLTELGVPTVVHYPRAIPSQPAFQAWAGNEEFKWSQFLSQRVMSLPMHAYLSESDQDRIFEALLSIKKKI